jgi:hypothetical protein
MRPKQRKPKKPRRRPDVHGHSNRRRTRQSPNYPSSAFLPVRRSFERPASAPRECPASVAVATRLWSGIVRVRPIPDIRIPERLWCRRIWLADVGSVCWVCRIIVSVARIGILVVIAIIRIGLIRRTWSVIVLGMGGCASGDQNARDKCSCPSEFSHRNLQTATDFPSRKQEEKLNGSPRSALDSVGGVDRWGRPQRQPRNRAAPALCFNPAGARYGTTGVAEAAVTSHLLAMKGGERLAVTQEKVG